jgi:hypothetical protein
MENKSVWKFALIPVIAMAILAIYPELSLWIRQGSGWNGSYFVSNYDEVAYSAYVNALMNGNPRKSDPFLAVQESLSSTQPESPYSIQFVPAYSIALTARTFGLPATSAFIVLILFTAIATALAIFRLLYEITEEELLSAVGALVILCLGTAAAFQGEIRYWLQGRALCDFFPFLRRYQPGFAFPLFFVFCGLVWRSLVQTDRKKGIIYSVLGGLMLAVLVFSYFYLWTAAAAWLTCVTFIYLTRRDLRLQALVNAGIVGLLAAGALIPYSLMLANRSTNLDAVQLLSGTHLPHLASVSLVTGLLIAAALLLAVWKGIASLSSHRTLFAISFALTPLILSNQQILTGRSLQPVHYEIFISNYIVLTALILFLSLVFQHLVAKGKELAFRRALFYAALLAIGWGVIEATGSIKRSGQVARLRDESIPAIADVDRQERIDQTNGATYARPAVVLATNFVTSDFIPSVSSQRALWSPHTSSAGGIDIAENKRLFYLYLFYSGHNEKDLAEALKTNVFEVTAALFGSERALPALGQDSEPISQREVQAEIQNYTEFLKRFNRETAVNPTLSYLIVPQKEPNLNNVDKWYERDEGKSFGLFRVYKVKVRP